MNIPLNTGPQNTRKSHLLNDRLQLWSLLHGFKPAENITALFPRSSRLSLRLRLLLQSIHPDLFPFSLLLVFLLFRNYPSLSRTGWSDDISSILWSILSWYAFLSGRAYCNLRKIKNRILHNWILATIDSFSLYISTHLCVYFQLQSNLMISTYSRKSISRHNRVEYRYCMVLLAWLRGSWYDYFPHIAHAIIPHSFLSEGHLGSKLTTNVVVVCRWHKAKLFLYGKVKI